MKILLALLFALTVPAEIPGEETEPAERALPTFEQKILPVTDEAGKDPSLVKFRASLLKSVEKKDVNALLKHLDEKIKNDFGGGEQGVKGFKKTWKLDKEPAKSKVWEELSKVLKLGGGYLGEEFAAPYVYSHWPDEYEAFEYAAIVKDGVPLRAEAKDGAKSIRALKREIVYVVDTGVDEPGPWQEIATYDGKRGWVKAPEFHSPIGYRALFKKTNKEWKMTAFIAGD